MIKLVDVTYYSHLEYQKPEQVLERHHLVTRYAGLLKDKMHILFLKHAGFEGFCVDNGLLYYFFKGVNKFRYLALRANKLIANQEPDVVLVQGLSFPMEVIALRLQCGSRCKIVVQHHGEQPFTGIKLWLQRLAAKMTDAYLFTSEGNAEAWQDKGVIKKRHQIFEVLEASAQVSAYNKQNSRKKLNIPLGVKTFLWVGRLNANKDPLCILKAFGHYLNLQPSALLYMIYQTDDLLPDINVLLENDSRLKTAVILVGKTTHNDLPWWFSAADYYLSGSHKEGSGYALLEAMACGCIPVVTAIPPFRKITAEGKYGYLFKPGDCWDLYRMLCKLEQPQMLTSEAVINHFNESLSFDRIAEDVYEACRMVVGS
ncbi:glycosyltransferase family 4 protein [Mucilaginibacter agri]|uniref:Glycosyltransferase n=1 Tax=Mucilaginibacter agri TaxID=2695265 RepID=A0A965ZFB4_9SPHI|nr:glycosyltransferase family 4 protein [Mucilaginibacter agri]NCD69057.1 glycosyltransferase [Mucilaginibacter agri]